MRSSRRSVAPPQARGGSLLRGPTFGAHALVVGSVRAFAVVRRLQKDFVSSAVSPSVVTAVVAFGVLCLLLGATNGPALDARNTDPAPLLKDE